MDLFTVLEYDFPLKFNQFIEYLENTNIKYKIKNNIYEMLRIYIKFFTNT